MYKEIANSDVKSETPKVMKEIAQSEVKIPGESFYSVRRAHNLFTSNDVISVV